MNSSLSSIHSLVSEIRKTLFSSADHEDLTSFVSPSAYDTAWLAMIPNESNEPMFRSCLNWVLENQSDEGFWGETFSDDRNPTIDALPATLACLIALKNWKVGEDIINKGLAFMNEKAESILKENNGKLPKWFFIVFPAMVELALSKGLRLIVPQGSLMSHVSIQDLDENAEDDDWSKNSSPLLSNLECLPPSYHENVVKKLSEDGSLFQSPSATAKAFMLTGNTMCFEYLMSLVHKCPNGVPAKYPVDVELTKLSMVDHVQRLGLAEHFTPEIHHILQQIYRNTLGCQDLEEPTETHFLPTKLYKDALRFRLLRMEGYPVKPSSFCWFLQYPKLMEHIEKNFAEYAGHLYVVHRATNLMFDGEFDVAEAQLFSRKLLEKSMSIVQENVPNDTIVITSGLQKLIEQELAHPWIARLDHLDHRTWIEETENKSLWFGNASFCSNEKLMQLARENYEYRQSIYAHELEQVKRWSTESGLANIGFGREKTVYTYFGMAASTCLPHDSIVRMLGAKIAVLVTIADDFYDTEGHFSELEILTDAVKRWNGKNLEGHGKTIFSALNDLVQTTSLSYHHPQQEGYNFLEIFKDIWKETFQTWMVERTWSTTGYQPSLHEYLDTGMISTAAHTITLPSSCFLGPNSTVSENHRPGNYRDITKLLMAIARLLNDNQSYQREELEGKINMVLLHLRENPELQVQDSIAHVRGIVDEKTRKLLQIVLTDHNNMPNEKAFMNLHLSCMKVFYFLFNTSNLFDTKEDLMDDIKKAIYIPPRRSFQIPASVKVKPTPAPVPVSDPRKKIEISFKTSKPMAKLVGFKEVAQKDFKANAVSICCGRAIKIV